MSLVSDLSVDVNSACYRLTAGAVSSDLTPPNTPASKIGNNTCPDVNPGSSNTTANGFFTLENTVLGANNFSTYDKDLVTPWPLLVTSWIGTGVKRPGGGGGWADTRLLCIPRNHTISEGSRNVGVTGAGLGAPTTTSGSGTTPNPAETKKPNAGNKALGIDVSILSLVAVVSFGVLV